MKIINHLLHFNDGKQVIYKETPNKNGIYRPQYLVMHYTAATTASSAISWFQKREAQASAHLLIDRQGEITQFAPFTTVCWHAGKSTWKGLSGLNQHSIGIELVNAGRLGKSGSSWVCPVDQKKINAEEVVLAVHKNEDKEAAWHSYSDKQLEVALDISALLVQQYELKDVLGHEDISPLRKSDPGPAFPMASFRSKAMGRQNEALDDYTVTAELNIRSGPGTSFPVLSNPLPQGTSVSVLKTSGNWSFVEVNGIVQGLMDLEGWVASKYLSI